MATLLLRFAAPLQSWGSNSKFDIRTTEREPTKSGVIGMIAAALGIRREDSPEKLKELSELRFGVRVEKEGKLLKDFHTARPPKSKNANITYRYYLADAVFLVALCSDDTELLNKIKNALEKPVFPLFLGRRSCPPTLPLVLGIRDKELVEVLKEETAIVDSFGSKRIVYEVDCNGTVVQDVPVSFSQLHRIHSYRMKREEILLSAEHDPMAELHENKQG